MISRKVVFIVLFAVLCASGQLLARDDMPTSKELKKISGRTTDRNGASLPRVLVDVRNEPGRLVASTQTNGRGEFSLELAEGAYSVSARLGGFAPLEGRRLEVTPYTAPLQLTLEVSPLEEQIVVTATRTEAPMSQVGNSVTVISGEKLTGDSLSSVAEALREVAGVALVQSGPMGQVTSLFLRGGNAQYTKVLIDGIPVNEPGGAYNFANLSSSSIERIEVVRGPQSALFGSDAVSGVVQIFTKQGTSEGLSPKPGILLEGGDYATFRYGGSLEGSADRLDYAISFSRLDTDNQVWNGSFNEETISGNLGIRPSGKTELRAVFRSEAGRAGTPGPWAFERPDAEDYYRRRDEAGSLALTYFATVSWTQKVSYSVSDSRQLSADPIDSGNFVPKYQGVQAPYAFSDYVYQNLNQTRRKKVNYQSDLILPGGHLLTVGGDYEHQSGKIGDPQQNPILVSRHNSGGYFQDQWSLSNRFFATGGVRFDHNGSFGFYASPRASLAFLAHETKPGNAWGLTKIRANFGLGIKEPTLIESFSPSLYYLGNPNLRPMKATCFDAGIEQQFQSGRAALEVTYFKSHFRDQIEFDITDYQTWSGSFFNLGKSRVRGVETVARYSPGWDLEISASYTYLDSKVLESSNSVDPIFAKGQELLRRPGNSGLLDLRWKPGRWILGATGVYVGSRADSDFSNLGLTRNRRYKVLNLMAGLQLGGGVSLYAKVNNALNESYMEVLGYPALRTNYRIGLNAGF
jgi:vitamin B12 transporter